MKKKWTVWLMLSCMLVGIFVSCKPEDPNKDSSATGEKTLTYVNSLVKGSDSEYTIIYPRGEEAPRFAATEMQAYLEKSTDVTVSVMSDYGLTYAESAKYISLGKTTLLSQINLDYDYTSMKEDGFFVKTIGNSVFIDGPSDRSVIYGAYDFLEEEVGVRFVTEDYDYVPKREEVKIMSWDRVENPDFIGRSYYDVSTKSNQKYCVKMRMSHGMMDISDEMGGNFGWANTIIANHNAIHYVTQEEYPTSEYPHFYSIKGGAVKDICWTYGITEDGKLDPAVTESPIRAALNSLKRFVATSDQNSKYFMFAQMDGDDYCVCDRCLQDASKYRRSGIAIRFVNILADEIQKWSDENLNGREVNVVTFAYTYTQDAPVSYNSVTGEYELLDETVKPRSNVVIRLARLGPSIYYAYSDEHQSASTREFFDEWKAVHNRFFIWTYHGDWRCSFDLAANIHTWSRQFNDLKEMGVEDVFMQGHYQGADNYKEYLETYVASKMLWNIDIDVAATVAEFNRLYFGEAAVSYVDEYLSRHLACIHVGFANGTLSYGTTVASSTATSAVNFPLPFVLKQLVLIEEAMEATETNTSLSEDEKTAYMLRLVDLRLYAKFLQLDNYISYYGVTEGRYELACSFREDCLLIGETYYAESTLISTYLEQYGI